MGSEFPDIIKEDEEGLLTEPHPIWVSKDMYSEIQVLKERHGKRAVNRWLRQLWRYGLEMRNQSDGQPEKSAI